MGCVFYYVLTAVHPFEGLEGQEYNIRNGMYSLSAEEGISRRSLVEEMIQQDPDQRPSAEYVAMHPTFWLPQTTTDFSQALNHLLTNRQVERSVDKYSCLVLGGNEEKPDNWKDKIDACLYEKVKGEPGAKYDLNRLDHLLRLFRNKLTHFDELSEEIKDVVGATRKKLIEYWDTKFPGFLLCVWLAAAEWKEELPKNEDLTNKFYPSAFTLRTFHKLLLLGFKTDHKTELLPNTRTKEIQLLIRGDLPLEVLADTCQSLETMDLTGFVIDTPSLRKLAQQNSAQLMNVTLPAGFSFEHLETLLPPLKSLKKLTVECPCDQKEQRDLIRMLPMSLETLDISGIRTTQEKWCSRRPKKGLSCLKSLSLRGSGVTNMTLSSVPHLSRSITNLSISADCSLLTASGLLHVSRLTRLTHLTLHGLSAGVFTDAGQDGPEDRWLQKLPESLEILNISGLEAPLRLERMRSASGGLAVYIRHVTDSTLASLHYLAPRLTSLDIADCRDVTARGLLLVGRLTKLKFLTLRSVSAGVFTDALQDSPEDTGRWLQELPESLEILNISGLDGSEMCERMHSDNEGLAVYISPVTNSTLASLTYLADRLTELNIADCSLVTASGLLHVSKLTELKHLILRGVPAGFFTDALQGSPQDTGRWLQELPNSLTTLCISGLEAPLRLERMLSVDRRGLRVYIRRVTDSALASLHYLAPRLTSLDIADCPDVTASGLLLVGRLTKLKHLYLRGVPAGSITDAWLDGLNSCSELWVLQLGDKDQPPQETAITAAAVSRLAVACRELLRLDLHTTADSSQAVLDGLHRADLEDSTSWHGQPRTISLRVPDPVLSQLGEPPSDSQIEVMQWL